jgi:hypothetical protein
MHAENKRLGIVEMNAWIAQYDDDELAACRIMKGARARIISLDAALRDIADAAYGTDTPKLRQRARAALAKAVA